MEAGFPSGVRTVDDPAAARALTTVRTLRMLSPFLGGECSAGEAARRLGMPISSLAYWIGRLTAWGLLSEVRQQKRGGRAIRLYQASASSFLVPLTAVPAESLAELHDRIHERSRQSMTHHQMAALEEVGGTTGVLIYPQEGALYLDYVEVHTGVPVFSPGSPAAVGLEHWEVLRLSAPQARALQQELVDLIERYRHHEGPRTCLLSVRLATRRRR